MGKSWLILAMAVAGCGGTSPHGTDAATGAADLASPGSGGNGAVDLGHAVADLAQAKSTVSVVVPATYTGTPRQLLVAAFDSLPVTGPPAGILYEDLPTITAGATLHLAADPGTIGGAKQVIAVLYMQGGGQFSPTAGIDYESAPLTITFGGAPMDLGTLTLALVPASP